MVIDWGKSARMWHQKGTTEKTIVAIDSADKHPFVGYEKVILTYDKLKEIVEDKINYELWQAALSNVKGVYLIWIWQTENNMLARPTEIGEYLAVGSAMLIPCTAIIN